MKFILIIWMFNARGAAIHTQEFNTMASCDTARTVIAENSVNDYYKPNTACVAK